MPFVRNPPHFQANYATKKQQPVTFCRLVLLKVCCSRRSGSTFIACK